MFGSRRGGEFSVPVVISDYFNLIDFTIDSNAVK